MKPLAPEVLALIPNGIENFTPRCTVCGSAVPLARARGRQNETCSPPCYTVRKLFRKWLLSTRKCIACLHPATAKEREEFKAWRRHRGDILGGRGRPKLKKALDKPSDVSATPDIALCTEKQREKAQDIVSKNGP